MSSYPPGTDISQAEVSAIGSSGFWVLAEDREYFVPFADYPAFRRATVEQIMAVERVAPDQLRWDALDIDIELDSLEHPEHYPLVWRD